MSCTSPSIMLNSWRNLASYIDFAGRHTLRLISERTALNNNASISNDLDAVKDFKLNMAFDELEKIFRL